MLFPFVLILAVLLILKLFPSVPILIVPLTTTMLFPFVPILAFPLILKLVLWLLSHPNRRNFLNRKYPRY